MAIVKGNLQVRFYTKTEVLDQNVVEPVVEEGSYKVWEDASPFGYASNFPCPTCRQGVALFNVTEGVFVPCGPCRLKGYHTFRLKKNTRFIRWLVDKLSEWGGVGVISDTVNIDNTR